MDFQVDPLVARLAAHSTVARTAPETFDDVWGLVLVANWTPPLEIKTPYEDLSSKVGKIDPASLYVYPFRAMHCTVATLVNFKQTVLKDASSKARVQEAFKRSLASLFSSPEFPSRKFTLRMNPPTLSKAAVFFLYDDSPEGTIAQIRDQIRTKVFPEVKEELGEELFDAIDARIPNILHSTFGRFKAAPADPAGLLASLGPVLATWEPVEVEISNITLAIEYLPYMHIPVEPGSIAIQKELA